MDILIYMYLDIHEYKKWMRERESSVLTPSINMRLIDSISIQHYKHSNVIWSPIFHNAEMCYECATDKYFLSHNLLFVSVPWGLFHAEIAIEFAMKHIISLM